MKSQQEINEANQRRLKAFAADLLAEKAEKEARKKTGEDRKAKSKTKPK